MEQKVRFQMRISEKTDQAVKAAIPLANCRARMSLWRRRFSTTAPTCKVER